MLDQKKFFKNLKFLTSMIYFSFFFFSMVQSQYIAGFKINDTGKDKIDNKTF